MPTALSLLGAPAITHGGTTCALARERRAQLLVYLAMKRTWVGRSEVATLLWPDAEAGLAAANVRKALHRLQSLPGAEAIEVRGSALRLEVATDVHAFETALRDHRLTDGLKLWKGNLLDGFDDYANEAWTGWLGFERERLRVLWTTAARQRLADDVDPIEGVELAARLHADEPLDEDALRVHVHWLARAGQLASARRVHQAFVARLRSELGIEPGGGLATWIESLERTAPLPRAAMEPARRPHHDDFVGRAVELRRLKELLGQADCRLLSITGPGGAGKTRLAQRAADELRDGFADGAIFVALGDLVSAGEIGGRLARELGIPIKGVTEALEQVITAAAHLKQLLVLDNLEHLVDAAPLLETLLAHCPGIKLLVTSRARLALADEWLLPLEGMPYPDPVDAGELESFDAARLFLRAARRVQPALDAARDATAIIEICRRVEGLPLALELAASWTRVLSCRDIAAELARGIELLRVTDAARAPRHASIEAVFEESWRLLGERERRTLAGLAVFRGGFTPAAARAVGDVPLPVLASLVDKSLVRKEGNRCALHPLVHQFAQAKLEQDERAASSAAAHSRYFLHHLADAGDRIRHAEPEVLRDLDLDFDNIRAAWRHAVKHGPAGDLSRAAYSLMSYCTDRGRHFEGFELLHAAIGDKTDLSGTAPALIACAAWLAFCLDRYTEAAELGRRTLEAATTKGAGRDGNRTAFRAATVLGAALTRLGRADDAYEYVRAALDYARKAGDPVDVVRALDNVAVITHRRGDLEGGLQLHRQALLKYRELGDASGEVACLNNLAVSHVLLRQFGAAQDVLQDAHRLCERHGMAGMRTKIECNLASVALASGNNAQASDHAREAHELAERTGQRSVAAEASYILATAALRLGDLPAARRDLAVGLTTAIAIDRRDQLAVGVCAFAEVLAAQGDVDVAAQTMAFALRQHRFEGEAYDDARRRMASWGRSSAETDDWTGPSLEELAYRIVAEAAHAYAPLIASLRSR